MSQRSFTSRSSRAAATAALAACLLPSPGCMLEERDDGAEYREALPQRQAVVVAGPETDSEPGASAQSLPGVSRAQAEARPFTRTEYAKWYGFTRVVRGSVNLVTAAVLGSAWAIAHTEPSSVENGEAVWGPYTDALEPVTYRFRVTRVAEGEYDYVLEGRPKTSQSDSDYLAVLAGHGFGKRHDEHGQGEFTIDLDAARTLDPFAHENDSGTVRIEHHLPADITDRADALPRTIIADVEPDPAMNPESFRVESVANEDGTGALHVAARGDVDDTKATQLEDILVDSRWRADGAGRADIVIAGGDIPADPGTVTAVECWGGDFLRSYYSDSVDFAPTEGDASACVYAAP